MKQILIEKIEQYVIAAEEKAEIAGFNGKYEDEISFSAMASAYKNCISIINETNLTELDKPTNK